MKSMTLIADTPTLVSAGGPRDFLNIQNNDSADIYCSYDGATDAATALDDTNGWVIGANGGTLFISNDGNKSAFNKPVYLYSVAGTSTNAVRVQGAET